MKTISATQARIHFGQLMRQAQDEPVIIERNGKAAIVVKSKYAYDQLAGCTAQPDWRKLLTQAHQRIRKDLAGQSLPPIEEELHKMRDERYEIHDLLA